MIVCKGQLDSFRDFLRDLALQEQQILQFAVVLVRPEMGLVAGPNELGGDAHSS